MQEYRRYIMFAKDSRWRHQKDSREATNLPSDLLSAVQEKLRGKPFSKVTLEIDDLGTPELTVMNGARFEVIPMPDVTVNVTQLSPVEII